MSEQKNTKHKRTKVYVDRHVQGGVVLRLGAIWLTTTTLAVIVSVMLGYFSNPVMGFDYYLQQSWLTCGPLLLAFAAVLPIAALHLVRFTHRCVGPIVRLRRAMRELTVGEDIELLRFREKDYWHGLAGEFNDLSQQLTSSRQEVAGLRLQLEELQGESDTARLSTEKEPAAIA